MAMFIFTISVVMILSTNSASGREFAQGHGEPSSSGFITVERRLQAKDDDSSTTSSSSTAAAAGGIASHREQHVLRNEVFSSINRRRHLAQCKDSNPYIGMTIDASGSLADVQNVTVTVSGVKNPDSSDWIGIMSPMTAK
jgi:hypothetical protein